MWRSGGTARAGSPKSNIPDVRNRVNWAAEMDRICLQGVPLRARLGELPEERAFPQKLLLDLTIELELEAAANTDSLDLTVDYKKLVDRLQDTAQKTSCNLLETLTLRLCNVALDDPKVSAVQIKVRKFPAELTGQVESVAVEMTRKK
ncbi:MAG: dihydroneopterin aldolase [Acidobacteria bacterium]|nr:MAG: dihydroneopterin aldolase [Acidobacteriota bacterium]